MFNYQVSPEEVDERIKKLKNIGNVLDSNVSDYEKAKVLIGSFRKMEDLSRSYSKMIKYGKDDKRLDSIRHLLANFDELLRIYKKYEESGMANKVKKDLSLKPYTDNWDNAQKIVELYLDLSSHMDRDDFLKQYNISKEELEFAFKTIRKVNREFYDKCMLKLEEQKKLQDDINIQKIKDVSYGILNGKFRDGKEFDILEFIKRVPFNNKEFSFSSELYYFMKKKNLSEKNILYCFIEENKLDSYFAFSCLDKEKLASMKQVVKGVEITEEIRDGVFNYLEENDIPLVNAAYGPALLKYLNSDIKEKESSKVLKKR